MIDEPMIQQCCFLEAQDLLYRQPGEEIIYHQKEAQLQCQKGWTGRNCESCAPTFDPTGECSRCRTGWTGYNCDTCALGWLPPDCSTCRFGFSTESNCTECIQNGLWTGKVDDKNLTVWLTFTGDTCATVASGKFTSATHTMIAY